MTGTSGGEDDGLFSWDVRSGDQGRAGAGGVTPDRRRAVEELARALQGEPPGTSGTVWRVRLRPGGHAEYSHDDLTARGLHDPRTGAVVVESPWGERLLVLPQPPARLG